ncbi:MAG: hypothetical protein ABI850_16860 [Flavobacterium sp.]
MKTVALIVLCLFSTLIQAQENPKDTLFFTYDKKYITTHIEIPNHFYIKDGSGVAVGNFYFTEVKKIKNQNVKSKKRCLQKFIRSSKFYDKNKKLKLNDYRLWEYLKDFVIVLVKDVENKKEYIEVESSYEIE